MATNGKITRFLAFMSLVLVGAALYLRAGWNGPVKVISASKSSSIASSNPAYANPVTASTPEMIPSTFKQVAENLEPVVVNIFTTQNVKMPGMGLFPGHQRRQNSLGSGFVVGPEGYILTNNHVVGDADEIRVQFTDEREYSAVIVGLDPQTDIALIKIVNSGKQFPYVALGDSDQLNVGDWVVAVGNPFGLGGTVTAGIVSAKSRFIRQTRYDDFIQTDASINPGNSGGPLVNLKGEVVGINTSIYSPSGGNVGIGFAIPVNLVKTILPQLKESGKVTRSWFGVVIQHVTPELAESYGLTEATGALVADVYPGSPANKAGVKPGDVILKINDTEIQDQNQLARVVSLSPVDSTITITVMRENNVIEIPVTLVAMPDQKELALNRFGEQGAGGVATSDLLGATVSQFTPVDPRNLGAQSAVKIVRVREGSPAQIGGLAKDDIIIKINGESVGSVDDFRRIAASLAPGELVRMLVLRGEGRIFLAFRLK